MEESFGLLRRGQVEHAVRCAFGLGPHQRWQALLGRADTGVVDAGIDSSRSDSSASATLRSFVRLSQFLEDGVSLSDEWRSRSRSYRLKRRGASVIELTKAERAATVGQVPATASAGIGLGVHSASPLPHTINSLGLGVGGGWHFSDGALPPLAASLAEGSDGDDVAIRPLCTGTSNGDALVSNGVNVLPAANMLEETGEVVSFFLEVGITELFNVEHTLIAAALSTTGQARVSLRPVVGETYQIMPCQLQEAAPSRRSSLEAALLPSEPPRAVGVKRAASWIDAGHVADMNGMASAARALDQDCVRPTKKVAFSSLSEGLLHAARLESSTTSAGLATEAPEDELQAVVQVCYRLIPFARLQHALLRVGTGLSLDFHDLTHYSGALRQVPQCVVLLAGEDGWSSPEVAATSARVTFRAGHSQVDGWEWDVTLGSSTLLMDYAGAGVAEAGDQETAMMETVCQWLPLAKRIEIARPDVVIEGAHAGMSKCEESTGLAGLHVEDSALGGGKWIKFCFPPCFSVHAMCRSFALAGEGLAAMQTLVAQATKLRHDGCGNAGYCVVSCSPVHVAMRDSCVDHVVLLTHSAFSARHISSAERPRLVLIPLPNVLTCPAAMRELEAAVTKHRDLSALLHGLSRTMSILAVVSRIVPGVGSGAGTDGDGRSSSRGEFVLTAISPACFVLSACSPKKSRGNGLKSRPALTLVVQAAEQVLVSGNGRKDVVADTAALRDLLLEWIASYPE